MKDNEACDRSSAGIQVTLDGQISCVFIWVYGIGEEAVALFHRDKEELLIIPLTVTVIYEWLKNTLFVLPTPPSPPPHFTKLAFQSSL